MFSKKTFRNGNLAPTASSAPRGQRGEGQRGEAIAARYLIREGCTICARNVYTPAGEIDIVAEDALHLLFVEVKLRTAGTVQARYGQPARAVNAAKRRHIVESARHYLREHPTAKQPRFDVIEILVHHLDNGFVQAEIRRIPNAFGADSY